MPESLRDLKYIYPVVRAKFQAVIDEMNRAEKVHGTGIVWIITETYRTSAMQRVLYAKGRSAAGPIVTYKDGINHLSNHQYGLAMDLAPTKLKGGKKVTCDDDSDVNWAYLGHCARANGLEWGGDWSGFKDTPHVQYPKKGNEDFYKQAFQWASLLRL